MNKARILIIGLSLWFVQSAYSQTLLFHSDFHQILDNREYFSKYGYPQTILGARLNLMGGVQLDTNHAILGGLNYMYEYGGNIDEVPIQINLFYRYQDEHTKVCFGSFPRRGLLNYPLMMLTDTLNYYRPNIDGGFLGYSGKWGNVNVWCDWTSRQTETRRESFLAGIFGQFKYRFLYLDYYAYMFHFAGDATKAQHIRDNGSESAFLGVDLSFLSRYIQTLKVDVGIVASYDRVRPNPYVHYAGLMSRIHLHFKRFGADAVIYSGNRQQIAYGDQLYTSGQYQRLDLFIVPFKSKQVSSRFSFNMHFIKGEMNTSQQLSIIATFGARKKIKLNR